MNIDAITKRFFMKYYPQLLNSNSDEDHAKLQVLIGESGKAYDFFDKHYTNQDDKDYAFSAFCNALYGIGKNKVRYNEHDMLTFDHSVCKNLNDLIYHHQMVGHHNNLNIGEDSFDDGVNDENYLKNSCTWIYTTSSDGRAIPYALVDIYCHVWWSIDALAYDIFERIMNPKDVEGELHGIIDDDTGLVYYDIHIEYDDPIHKSMDEEFLDIAKKIAIEYSNKIVDRFKDTPTVIFKNGEDPTEGNTIIVPSVEVAKKFDILNFEESLNKGYMQEDIIEELVYDVIAENIEFAIESEYKKMYHKHSNSVDIFKNKKTEEPILMEPEVFALMIEDGDDIDENETH